MACPILPFLQVNATEPLQERSNLADREMVKLLLGASNGITGSLTELIVAAARQALRVGQERVSVPILQSLLKVSGEVAA